MKAYTIGVQEGLASLTLTEKPTPIPGPGEALVKVSAVCLNHRDLLVIAGKYGPKKPQDRVPCADGVGVVEAVGPGVTAVKPGERVNCTHFVSWLGGAFAPSAFALDLGVTLDGWLAEYVLVPAASLVAIPANLGDAQAAPLPSAGVTAWHAVVEHGRAKAGDLVLALGTGGVAVFALQIAKASGAKVAITSSSDDKLARARALGADYTVNYRTQPDWAAALLEQTGGRGADVVVETGGAETLPKSIAAAAANGRIAIIGSLSGGFAGEIPNFPSIIGKNLLLKGIAVGSRAMLQDLVRAVDASGLTPPIDRAFPFAEAPAAYAHLKSGEHLGKVMITL